jgi:hypothetical protein
MSCECSIAPMHSQSRTRYGDCQVYVSWSRWIVAHVAVHPPVKWLDVSDLIDQSLWRGSLRQVSSYNNYS